ncbi:FIST signal transduction protein [Shewanella inventionis]|uniref:Histidine kinase n=1 Tax=Shewanella inventionis TaxID=1738770 RepID=A0ABQ1IPS6_9GAMM|nr:FIST N-terminal domain-containing protein [Shewanella inventionis]MCL1157678.1 FIST C-terminal domain-containing protein [Shewanella inventionis]GGB48450.1 hypothetical protein GCM10011607_05970 [Shewanella inventionis]
MNTFQAIYQDGQWNKPLVPHKGAQLVLVYGAPELMQQADGFDALKTAFPNADIIGGSTSGEIQSDQLYDDSLCITAITFEHSDVHVVSDSVSSHADCSALIKYLIAQLPKDNLRHVLVMSDGNIINGSELVDGLYQYLPQGVKATGGLAGDGDRFNQTIVWHNEHVGSGIIVLAGLYGERLSVGYAYLGGWRPFGPKRLITRSHSNVLFEFDGQPALDLYRSFLGEFSADLPVSALLYPLALQQQGEDEIVVRTILSIDEHQKSMSFAGNLPEGATCQFMYANGEDLLEGAQHAAHEALASINECEPELAILISCIGRRLVLGQQIEEELEIIKQEFPTTCNITGFYSYGEISPIKSIGRCGLHNQTMAVTLLSEKSPY